jgi:hypothetical protein
MGHVPLQQHDVERILRDILQAQAWDVSLLSVEPIPDAWRVTITDAASRVITSEIPTGPPATIRAAVARWLDSQA